MQQYGTLDRISNVSELVMRYTTIWSYIAVDFLNFKNCLNKILTVDVKFGLIDNGVP